MSPLVSHDGTVELELRPFELVTLAFDLGSAGLHPLNAEVGGDQL